jgi:MoaA/NifB/PqqE/SkfB family radical SAM enzyme
MSGSGLFTEGLKQLNFARHFAQKGLIHLNMQLLYDCNFRCTICDFWKEPYQGLPRLTAAQVEVMAQRLKPLGPLIISLGGGEPLLHRELEDIVRILSQDNFPVMICNGWFVTPEKARALFKAGLYEVSISLDYADPARHDAQRGRVGAFERAVSALRALHENRDHASQRVHMISVIMDDNLEEIEPLIKLARKIGVTYLVTFYSSGRGRKEGAMVQSARISRRLLELKKEYPEFVALPGYLRRIAEADNGSKGIFPCYAGKHLFNIDCRGEVTRCIDRLDNPVGNILADDLDELRKRLLLQQEAGDCGDCWTSCRGNVESLMYGRDRLQDLMAYYHLTKRVPLVQPVEPAGSPMPSLPGP